MIKGIIFDLDGVILSTDKFHYLAWKQIADQEGIYFDKKINNRLRGVSRMDSLNIVLERSNKEYTDSEKINLANQKNEIYINLLEQLNIESVSRNVISTLHELKKKGLKLAIGSSSKNTKLILNKVGLTSLFDVIVDGNMINHSKPHPEVFLKASEILGLKPSEALVVEDAIAGIESGTRGGFKTIGLLEASEYSKTTYPIKNFEEIIEIVNNLNEDNKPKIVLKHIKKVYSNGVEAVKDFSLDIYDKEFVVFVGPSGCGKSTVLRMIAGLEEITDGELYINDKLMNDVIPMNRNIAMVFQNYALYPNLTVRQNIAFPLNISKKIPFFKFFSLKYRKERKKEINEIVEEIAKKINLYEYLDRKPANLSGGQRQRVALGRSMVRNPSAFLLDEPLSNLDAKMRAQMRTEISTLHNDLQTIFIYVTHDQIEAMTMGTKIVVLKEGIIQQVASPKELFLHPINKFVAGFIGTPQMNFFKVKLIKEDNRYFVEFNDKIKLYLPQNIGDKISCTYYNQYVTLGIRPKAIVPSENINYKEQNISAIVKITEQLGDEALIYMNINGIEGTYISSSDTYSSFAPGTNLKISMDLTNACLFDIKTEGTIVK